MNGKNGTKIIDVYLLPLGRNKSPVLPQYKFVLQMLLGRILADERMAAQTAGKSNSAACAFYRRLRSRLGTPKAITATAHKIARIFYKLWTQGGDYTDPGMDYYGQRYRERMLNNLQKKAHNLGFNLLEKSSGNLVS